MNYEKIKIKSFENVICVGIINDIPCIKDKSSYFAEITTKYQYFECIGIEGVFVFNLNIYKMGKITVKAQDKYLAILREKGLYITYNDYYSHKKYLDVEIVSSIDKFHERLIAYLNTSIGTKLPLEYNVTQSKIYLQSLKISQIWFLYEYFYQNLLTKKDYTNDKLTNQTENPDDKYFNFNGHIKKKVIKLFDLENFYFRIFELVNKKNQSHSQRLKFLRCIKYFIKFMIDNNKLDNASNKNICLNSFIKSIEVMEELLQSNKDASKKENKKTTQESINNFFSNKDSTLIDVHKIFLALMYKIRNNFIHNCLIANDGLKETNDGLKEPINEVQFHSCKLFFLNQVQEIFENALINIHFQLLKEYLDSNKK